VLLLTLAFFACESQSAPTEFSYGTESEALAVYAVVLPHFLEKHPGAVVLDPQTTFSYQPDSWASLHSRFPSVSPVLWRSLPQANSSPVLLDPTAAAALAPDLVVAEADQRDALGGAGYFGPNAFTETFPGRSRLEVSRVAFSRDEREALVYVFRTSGALAGNGAIYALTRVGNAWAIVLESGLGAS
jgi:hypothetical protein